jgi:hypothetical protein
MKIISKLLKFFKKEPKKIDIIIPSNDYLMRKELEKDVSSNYLLNGRPYWR